LKAGEEKTGNYKTKKSLKILWITKLLESYNFKTSRIELSNALKKRNHQIKLTMEKRIGERKKRKNDILFIPSFSKPLYSSFVFGLFLIFYLPLVILKWKPNVILIDENTVWLPYTIFLKVFKIPLILDIRTLPVDNRRPYQFNISMKLSKFISNGYTMITPELFELLNHRYKLGNVSVGFWSSGVSIDNFSTPKFIHDKHIEKYRKLNKFILMYHGSYSPTRGMENLIRSINNLNSAIKKNIKLLIIGIEQENKKYLLDFCMKEGVFENIEFFPKVNYEKISEYIFSSDIGIIPLPTENKWWYSSAPLKTLEYLAMEKPIIVTNIPFHQRIFEKGHCGVLLEENSPEAIAEAITHLYQNKDKSILMGKKGRDIVEKYYTWDYKAMEVEEFLENILETLN
jgi:glycosyltransferase involved in cell wall biosynthesis